MADATAVTGAFTGIVNFLGTTTNSFLTFAAGLPATVLGLIVLGAVGFFLFKRFFS